MIYTGIWIDNQPLKLGGLLVWYYEEDEIKVVRI